MVQHPNPVLRSTIFSDGVSPGPQYQQKPQYQPEVSQEMVYQQPGNAYLAQQSENELETPGANLLGQNSMVDPLEMERRTTARQKAMEHQNSLRAQVAEKERKEQEKKRLILEEEAADRRRFEEDKRRLEEEKREEFARNIKLEQEKQEKVMEISRQMEESKRAAKLEKQRKRGQVTNDPKQDSPEQHRQWAQHQTKVEESSQLQPKTQGKMAHSPIPVRQPQYAPSPQQYAPSPQQVPQQPQQAQQASGLVRYISETGTQTVCEMSCQTSPTPRDMHSFNREQGASPGALHSESKLISISRETSHLMSDTAMLRLKTRELSTIQREDKKRSRIPERTKLPTKKGPSIPVRGKKEKPVKAVRPVEEMSKKGARYDKHGRRIRAEEEEVMKPQREQQREPQKKQQPEPQKKSEPKLFTTRESSLVIEQYQPVSELFQSASPPLPAQTTKPAQPSVVEEVQDELKWWNNTPSDLTEVIAQNSATPHAANAMPQAAATSGHSSATPSGFTLNADQIQLKYSSPNNDNGYIPSAISSRQNDILGQLAQLRLGLQNRRRVMSNTAAEMKV